MQMPSALDQPGLDVLSRTEQAAQIRRGCQVKRSEQQQQQT